MSSIALGAASLGIDSSPADSPAQLASDEASKWTVLVARIQAGEPEGMEALYDLFSRGIRFYLYRQLGSQDIEDKVHDTFLIVVNAIKRGEIRDPSRIMGFVRTVVRRQVAAHIDQAVHSRRETSELELGAQVPDGARTPEDEAICVERAKLIQEVLSDICERDREILTRFYLEEQTQEQICADMNLSATQFRLLKSRAKARFGEIGRKRVTRRLVPRFF